MTGAAEAARLKSCCADVYQSDLARILLGESFHPGGLKLTERVGALLELRPGMRLLDVASGKGTSAVFLARRFGCHVVGLDFGSTNVEAATRAASDGGVANLVTFRQGDAETMPFEDASFDALLCECAFCTFPDKTAAAGEFARVLNAAGRVGLSDLTRSGPLPKELEGLLAWISCIADARPVSEYAGYMEAAGFGMQTVESHDEVLAEMVRDVQSRLMGTEIMVKLGKLDLPGVDFASAKATATAAAKSVRNGLLGYSVLAAGRLHRVSPSTAAAR